MSGRIDLSRILSTGPAAADSKAYEIRPAGGGMRITAFVTGSLNGWTPIGVAVRNLADASEHAGVALALFEGGDLPLYSNGSHLVATAAAGIVHLVDPEVKL